MVRNDEKLKPKVLPVHERYKQKYAATGSLSDGTVVAGSGDIAKAIRTAKKRGVDEPIIMFVPDSEVVGLY